MKAIKTSAIITSIRSKVDGSLGLGVHTPEMTNDEKVEFLNLQGRNVNLLIEPEGGSDKTINVEKKLEGKTPSQRLRSVLFILWEQEGAKETFDTFYIERMENIIDWVKNKLD